MTYVDALDAAMYGWQVVRITTKSRGVVVGMPSSVDEFETDETRLGYFILLLERKMDSVFLDEILKIDVVPEAEEDEPMRQLREILHGSRQAGPLSIGRRQNSAVGRRAAAFA